MTSLETSPRSRLFGKVLLVLLAAAMLAVSFPLRASASVERGLGRSVAEQLEEEIGVVRDPALAGWVARVGAALVRADGADPSRYSFKILDTDDVNAFAVPGGFIYVTTGLLRFVESEDELAGVLGHEITHVAAHHGAKQMQRDLLLTLGLALLRGYVPATVSTLGQVGGVVYSLSHSRRDEAAADQAGIQRVARAGYDPLGMVNFLRKLNDREKHKPSRLEVYLMTHPPTAQRLAKAAALPEADRRNGAARRAAARGLEERGLYRQALAAYEEMLAREPEDPALHVATARCWARLGRYDRASEALQRARTLGASGEAEPLPSPPDPLQPQSPPSASDLARAADALARTAQVVARGRDQRALLVKNTRRDLAAAKGRFRSLLSALDRAAASVSPGDVVRQEMLRRLGLAASDLQKAVGRIEAVVEAGAVIPDCLSACAERVGTLLARGPVEGPAVALALALEPTAERCLTDLSASLGRCREVLRSVGSALSTCRSAANDVVDSTLAPAPFVLGRFTQIHTRIRSAANGAVSALRAAEDAAALADAADARRRQVALDLLSLEAAPAQRPSLYALLARQFAVPQEQAAALARDGMPLGQAAASLLLGMAAHPATVRPLPVPPYTETALPDRGPDAKPVALDDAIERGMPLEPLNVSLRLLALDVARETGSASLH